MTPEQHNTRRQTPNIASFLEKDYTILLRKYCKESDHYLIQIQQHTEAEEKAMLLERFDNMIFETH